MIRLLSALILSLFLIACSDDEVKSDPYADWSALEFYNESSMALEAGEFEEAIKHLENLEARFPFSQYARQAQLDVAYAYYKFDEPESAIAAADRFIRINPRDPNVAYAWYLKGLSDFNRGGSFIDGLFARDMSQHDSKSMGDALRSFSTLVERYPDSKYAPDSYQHMIFLRNKMAEAELHAARYYLKRKAWLAAAQRGQSVLQTFPNTPASRDALAIMVTAYKELGLNDLAADSQSVLDANPVIKSTDIEVRDEALDTPPN